ncbi:hypothetical protein SDC9_188508 [bioreactor metagenome]|uniref:Uncharacterized protein n=1 Tax=bioreactor metagenome TaxID=1076179 RepID=A0A645HPK0_9ZZZZ
MIQRRLHLLHEGKVHRPVVGVGRPNPEHILRAALPVSHQPNKGFRREQGLRVSGDYVQYGLLHALGRRVLVHRKGHVNPAVGLGAVIGDLLGQDLTARHKNPFVVYGGHLRMDQTDFLDGSADSSHLHIVPHLEGL